MLCRQCNTGNPPENRFCDRCGAALGALCPTCKYANRQAALFCGGCGRPIGDAGTGGALQALRAVDYTPSDLAVRILNSRSALEGERKQVTVLFSDIRGSTELIQDLDPEQALERFDPGIKVMMDAVHRYEGVVNRIQGDGIMALFGAPIAHEDHAVRACLAARAMLDGIVQLGVPLNIRVGMNSGEVVVRSIGNDLSMEYDAVGSTVHLAHRIEQFAVPGTACLSESTFRLASGFIEVRPLGSQEMKGFDRPVDVFELTSVLARSRWEVRATAQALTRFVGRDLEMAFLLGALKHADGGRGQIVGMLGEPGVGKSRLVHEFLQSDAVTRWTTIRTGAAPHNMHTPFALIGDLLRTWLGVTEGEGKAEIGEKLATTVSGIGQSLAADLAPLRWLLDLPNEDPDWERMDPSRRRKRALDVLCLLLLQASAVKPLVLVLEDLHWIDAESQSAVDVIANGMGTARLLLVATFRSEYRHDWTNRSHYSLIRVDPLEAVDADELLRSLIGETPELGTLRQQLIERSEGTPLFLEELVRSLMETGALVQEPRGVRLARRVRDVEIPQSVQAVLAARIDRLSAVNRGLLQIASVIGKDFPLSLLSPVARMPEAELHQRLTELRALEFLYEIPRESGVEFTFKHALTHDVAYESMLLTRRRELHGQVMRTIESVYSDRKSEFTERLADHALKANNWEKAAEYCCEAGQRANMRWAHHEAITHFHRALEALEHCARTSASIDYAIEVRLGLRVALAAAGAHVEIAPFLLEAEALARSINDRRRLALINISKCTILSILGPLEDGINAGRAGRELAEELDDGGILINASYALGQAFWYRGDLKEAERVLSGPLPRLTADLKLRYAGTTGTGSVLCIGCLANTHSLMGDFDKSIAYSDEACAIARETGRPYDLAYSHIARGLAFLTRGDLPDAIAELEPALKIARAGEIHLLVPATVRYLGRAYALAGRAEEACGVLEDSLNQSASLSLASLQAWCGSALASAFARNGQWHRAEAAAATALEISRRHRYRPVEVLALRALAEAVARGAAKDLRRAETCCREALQLADELGMRPESAHCQHDLADILQRAGRPAEAERFLSSAQALCRAMGMSRHASPPEEVANSAAPRSNQDRQPQRA